MTAKIHTELILMIKVLWNRKGEPENDPRENEMTQSRSPHNACVYYSLTETKQDSSFSDTDVEKEKEYRQKSTLCRSPLYGILNDYWLQPD